MARGRSITKEQEILMVSLYKSGLLSIKEIMRQTGIRSEQTIYRLLDQNNIPRMSKVDAVSKACISLERDVDLILRNQVNMSKYVNEAVRFYAEHHKK